MSKKDNEEYWYIDETAGDARKFLEFARKQLKNTTHRGILYIGSSQEESSFLKEAARHFDNMTKPNSYEIFDLVHEQDGTAKGKTCDTYYL